MSKVKTLRFGEIDVDDSKIIHFEHGIPAFDDEHQFIIIPLEENSPYLFLQSLQTPELSFIMTMPFLFFPDYEFNIDDDIMEQMKITSQEDLDVYVLITIPDGDVKAMTANLIAPVVVNRVAMQGRQVILERTKYTTKHRLLPDDVNGEGEN